MTRDAITVTPEQSDGRNDLKIAKGTIDQEAPEPRVGHLLALFVAFVELMVFSAVALGALLGVGALLHHLYPNRPFDVFYALHRGVIDAALAAICAVWLLPPYPWSKRSGKQAGSRPAADVR